MSHVVSIPCVIDDTPDDLKAIKLAAERIGLIFRKDQQNYRWYERWVNDYHSQDAAYHHGIKPEDYGKCSHAISQPEGGYEIGLVKVEGQKGFKLIFDFYENRLTQRVGGKDACKLVQAFQVEKAKIKAKKLGYHDIKEVVKQDGSIQLLMNR